MGLDVYVGALSRYYSGNWETIIQQSSHELGIEVQIIHANEPQYALSNQDKIRNVIINWREKLSNDLRGKISTQLDWNESAESPYFTDKPGWDSYSGLLVWAAYAEHPHLKLPISLPAEWSVDPAYQASTDEGFQSSYGQLLQGSELWLPGDFDFTFSVADVSGKIVTVGFTKTLLSQLDDLNTSTWNADKETILEWLQVAAGREAALETHARFAFSVFYELAKLSVENNLPMKLDY